MSDDRNSFSLQREDFSCPDQHLSPRAISAESLKSLPGSQLQTETYHLLNSQLRFGTLSADVVKPSPSIPFQDVRHDPDRSNSTNHLALVFLSTLRVREYSACKATPGRIRGNLCIPDGHNPQPAGHFRLSGDLSRFMRFGAKRIA